MDGKGGARIARANSYDGWIVDGAAAGRGQFAREVPANDTLVCNS